MKKKLFYAFALVGSMALFSVFPTQESEAFAKKENLDFKCATNPDPELNTGFCAIRGDGNGADCRSQNSGSACDGDIWL